MAQWAVNRVRPRRKESESWAREGREPRRTKATAASERSAFRMEDFPGSESGKRGVGRPIHKMKKVAFGIAEELNAATATSRFDSVLELDAP